MVLSEQNVLLVAVIILMQVFLLQAKSLRIAKGSQFTGDHDQSEDIMNVTKRTTDSSCSSADINRDQLEVLLQLYSGTGSVSNFNGNTMNYALRAEQSRNEPTTITVEDNELITNFDNLNRFTPAGMDLANKVVCARTLQELDAEANSISNTALCGWDYYCDYKANRFPNYLFKARCRSPNCNGNCNQENSSHNRCQSHGIHVTVLEIGENCREWVWGQELLPIACTCTSDVMMNA